MTTSQTAEVGTLFLSLLFNKGPTFPDPLSRKYGRPSPDALWGWGPGAEENKQNEESCLRICFGFVLPKPNSCCSPLHNFLLRWQNTESLQNYIVASATISESIEDKH